jgi:hypothetical protein
VITKFQANFIFNSRKGTSLKNSGKQSHPGGTENFSALFKLTHESKSGRFEPGRPDEFVKKSPKM